MDTNTIQPMGRGMLGGAGGGGGASAELPPQSSSAGEQQDFARILGRATSVASGSDPKQARQAAEEFVAMSLVQPLLAQLRSSNHTAAPFAPSSGETQFQQMLDAHLAQNIVRAKQFPLVDSVARKLLKNVKGSVLQEGAVPDAGDGSPVGKREVEQAGRLNHSA